MILPFLSYFLLSTCLLKKVHLHPSSEKYNNKLLLVEPNIAYLNWNYTNTDIIFEIHVKTDSWIMFGLSPSSESLEGSDVIVTWLEKDGKYQFSDRHIKNNRVKLDDKQDWLQLNVRQDGDFLVAKFTRKLKICDSLKQDIDIIEGTPVLLFAYGPGEFDENLNNLLYKKFFRATAVIQTLNEVIDYNNSDIEFADFTVNHTILPGHHTSYYCQVYKLPTKWLQSKTHVVKFQVLVTPGNEKYVHHLIVTECSKKYENEYLKTKGEPKPGLCSSLHESQPSSEFTYVQDLCYKMSFVWQVGGNYEIEFPSDKGYPVGGFDEEFKYFMVEIHYNNEDNDLNVKDYSGFRFYATQKLRPIEFGLLTFGATFDWKTVFIPPGIENHQSDYFMGHDCINELMNSKEITNGEIKMFASLFHTHNIGKQAYAKLIRDGKEVDYFYKNPTYDGMRQEYQYFETPITLKKTDQVKLTCHYNSKSKTTYTTGGLSAYEEMCQMWVMYYPRNPEFVRCKEMLTSNTWLNFLKSLNKTGDIKLENDTVVTDDQVPKDLLKARFTPNLKQKIIDFHKSAFRTQWIYDIDKNITEINNNLPFKTVPIEEKKCPNNGFLANFINWIVQIFKQ